MARYKWSALWASGFLIFFFIQAIIVIHYAQQLEERLESPDSLEGISAERLLSPANVSGEVRTYRRNIAQSNRKQSVRNTELFGNFSGNSSGASPVIVIQVHDRAT